jgi:16S rRNA (guanine966-N2)-methyltransferase
MKRKKKGSVRIIGGRWRGRRLPVPDLPGLRPSGDRSRETLFNWLAPYLHGANCADLFAGTGVLGLEAASRGAASVVLIEMAAPAAKVISANIALLQGNDPLGAVSVVQGNALDWLRSCAPGGLDLVFVDPPFGSGLDVAALELLASGDCLSEGGFVYLETPRQGLDATPGAGWEVAREKLLGDVRMLLLKKSAK